MRYSQKSDIWSVGAILYELFMRKKAFAGDLGVMGWVLSAGQMKEIEIRRRKIPNQVSCKRCIKDVESCNAAQNVLEETNLVLKRMIAKEPHERPSVQELKPFWQTRLSDGQ